MRPISASIVTLLPDPDSPTMPRTSPWSTDRLTSSTARSKRPPTGNSTSSDSISSSGICLSLQFRIEGITQPVAQQVEREHGDQDHEPGKGHDPPGPQHEFARVG